MCWSIIFTNNNWNMFQGPDFLHSDSGRWWHSWIQEHVSKLFWNADKTPHVPTTTSSTPFLISFLHQTKAMAPDKFIAATFSLSLFSFTIFSSYIRFMRFDHSLHLYALSLKKKKDFNQWTGNVWSNRSKCNKSTDVCHVISLFKTLVGNNYSNFSKLTA